MAREDNYGYCGSDCPMHPNDDVDAWTTDDKMKVTHHYNGKEIMTACKLYGIMASSLLLIGLITTRLGIALFGLIF